MLYYASLLAHSVLLLGSLARVGVGVVATGDGELEIGGVVLPALRVIEAVDVGVVAGLPLETLANLPAKTTDETAQVPGAIGATDIGIIAERGKYGRAGGIERSVDRDGGRNAERALL